MRTMVMKDMFRGFPGRRAVTREPSSAEEFLCEQNNIPSAPDQISVADK